MDCALATGKKAKKDKTNFRQNSNQSHEEKTNRKNYTTKGEKCISKADKTAVGSAQRQMSDYYYVESLWDCDSCGAKSIKGRLRECPSCGSPRERKELENVRLPENVSRQNAIKDPGLLRHARAGADWFCPQCRTGNTNLTNTCVSCHAEREVKKKKTEVKTTVKTAEKDPTPSRPTPPPPPPPSDDDNEKIEYLPPFDPTKYLIFGGICIFLSFVGYFVWWAAQTHEVEGVLSLKQYTHKETVHVWTNKEEREWKHKAVEKTEVQPVNGHGERAGFSLIPGSCRDEHYDTVPVKCGTRIEKYDCSEYKDDIEMATCTRTGRCHPVCEDLKNGIQKCRDVCEEEKYSCPKKVRVKVPKECEREVDKFCDEKIYKEKCTYTTQHWKFSHAPQVSMSDNSFLWPNVQPGRLERVTKSALYEITVKYTDDGKKDSFSRSISQNEYKDWEIGDKVYLLVANIGVVSEYSATPFEENK